MSSTRGGSDTTLAESATAAWTLAYDIPPSIAANSSPQRNNHEAAFASRAKASGSAMSPRLNLNSVGLSNSAIADDHTRSASRWRSLRVHPVEPRLERRLVRGGVDVIREQVGAHPDDAAVVVASEEAVQAVGRADAEELRRRVVDDAVEGPGVAERRVDRIAQTRVRGNAQGGAQRLHRVRRSGGLGSGDAVRRLADVRDRAAVEVLEVLREGVEVEVRVAADGVVLVLPPVGQDPAVDVAQVGGAAFAGLDRVVEGVEGPVRRLHADHEAVRRVPGHDRRPLGRRGSGGDLHARREHPRRGVGCDRGPDVVRGGGQVDLAGDLELATHDWGSLLFVMVGCRAATNRCERPPGAASSWYFATRPLTAFFRSTANAARSFADANRTSLSIPRVASGLPAALARVMSSPTSRTMRPATASSQRAERWSGSRDGSGATADRAVGEIT